MLVVGWASRWSQEGQSSCDSRNGVHFEGNCCSFIEHEQHISLWKLNSWGSLGRRGEAHYCSLPLDGISQFNVETQKVCQQECLGSKHPAADDFSGSAGAAARNTLINLWLCVIMFSVGPPGIECVTAIKWALRPCVALVMTMSTHYLFIPFFSSFLSVSHQK